MLKQRILWLAALLRLSLYIFLYFSMGIARSGTGLIGKRYGEEEFYFKSIDNLIKYGQYNYELNYLPGYAGRMPGYGVIYGLAKIILPNNQQYVYNAVIATQILLGLVALFYLSKVTLILTNKIALAYTAAFLYALSPYSIQNDLFVFTESFASSALIISLYYFLTALKASRLSYYFIAGCWLSWVVFLRPFMLPFFGFWILAYAYYHRKIVFVQIRQTSYAITLLLLPFIIPDALWTARNWFIYKRFIPLQTEYAGMQYSDLHLETRSYVAAMGEEPVLWSTTSLIAWLTRSTPPARTSPQPWQLTTIATYDSLVWLRNQILISSNDSMPALVRAASEKRAVSALRRYHNAFIKEHPLRYYLLTPLRLTYYLALPDNGASVFAWPFNELSIWQKAIRLFFTAWHWFWTGIGLFSFLIWPRKFNIVLLLIRLAPIYCILLFVVVLHHVEQRYFFLVYPLTLVSAIHGIFWLWTSWRRLLRF
ncbi:hypothetical protein [Hymenobacter sp. YC55]|uniref:hypothetical protein n=1 Tax=Hymenobacter sp. YC55 TaxID=3034019 RepID=UPI0023F952A0|nr:hypothetical protein [Hymenobacter sp. YC55]MDF7812398.1 hypothetical protein [Hymenobacter sp. YC55]